MKPQAQPRLASLRERASCGACEFGTKTANNDSILNCRRRAPVLMNSAGGAVFPTVNENDWCGDFREELNA